MKIAYSGLDVPQGKVRYNDQIFMGLVDKFKPAKSSPYYFEFLIDDYEAAHAIAIADNSLLDLLILDMEKIESRLTRVEDAIEMAVLEKCLAHLEDEKLLCDLPMSDSEASIVNAFGLLSRKPTVGKQEVHAWLVEKGADAVTCAGQIHSDLARGFIKAELISCNNMLTAHNLQDARSKDLTKLVDRDYIIPENTILDIRFNV